MTEPARLHCPNCGRYLGTAAGYFEAPPCRCGCQATRLADGKIIAHFPQKGEQLRPRFMEQVEVKA